MSNPRRIGAGCAPRQGLKIQSGNLSLQKGSTFHSPTSRSPPTIGSPRIIPSLPRRAQSDLDDVNDAHRRRAALVIQDLDNSFASLSVESRTSYGRVSPSEDLDMLDDISAQSIGAQELQQLQEVQSSLLSHGRRRSRHHYSDSGLGTSIKSSSACREPNCTVPTAAITQSGAVVITTEGSEDSDAEQDITDTYLSSRAVNRIHEHILKPLLSKSSLADFQALVLDVPKRIQNKQIICLRDLEKTLVFASPSNAKSVGHYLDFCMTSVRCLQATVEYLSDSEQTRESDRPYSSGYFIDLVEQIKQHAQAMRVSQERVAAGEELGEMDVEPTDEVKLMGGLATTGRPAELVCVKKDGRAISMATGEVVDTEKGQARLKRSLSHPVDDDEEVMRSMARRKKNPTPEDLAPKKCSHHGCAKEFKRPCDLTKHEKTHSRPFKCAIPTCKYASHGWPTEKELQRHVNDKHSDHPPMYECHYRPCPYQSKRESNCKQHMEKAHGYTYVRTKSNGRKKADDNVVLPQPMHNMMLPQPDNAPTPPDSGGAAIQTPPEQFHQSPDMNFHNYHEEMGNMAMDDLLDLEGGDVFDFNDGDHQLGNMHDLAGSQVSPNPALPAQPHGSAAVSDGSDNLFAHFTIPSPPLANDGFKQDFNQSFPQSFAPVGSLASNYFSPAGQANAMLPTPDSLAASEKNFGDVDGNADMPVGGDFELFPNADNEMDAGMGMEAPLFPAAEAPDAFAPLNNPGYVYGQYYNAPMEGYPF